MIPVDVFCLEEAQELLKDTLDKDIWWAYWPQVGEHGIVGWLTESSTGTRFDIESTGTHDGFLFLRYHNPELKQYDFEDPDNEAGHRLVVIKDKSYVMTNREFYRRLARYAEGGRFDE